MTKQKIIFVYDDFSDNKPILMGKLFVNVIKDGEVYKEIAKRPHPRCGMDSTIFL